MGRIEEKFQALRSKGEKALIAYVTAGDPCLEQTKEIVLGLESAGVDLVEIGVPFSDPTADGPAIQAASRRALSKGVTLPDVLGTIHSIRRLSEIPIVLFGYYNPILAMGNQRFARRAREAGVDGILVVDLPMEEWKELREYTDPAGIDFVALLAPTTGEERMHRICKQAAGFLYYISVTGVTGTSPPRVEDVERDFGRIREATSLPVVVGFGISSPEQVKLVARFADGVVIGSAFVRLIEDNAGRSDLVRLLAGYASDLKGCTRPGTR